MLYSEKMPIFTAKHPAQTVTVDGAAYARDMFETIFKDFQQAKDVTHHRPAGRPDEPDPRDRGGF